MKILVPIDDTEFSEAALPAARRYASDGDLELVLVSVGELPEVSEQRREAEEMLLRRLEEVTRSIDPGIGVRPRVHLAGDPVRGILEVAAEEQVDRIVIASHERSPYRELVEGSVAEELRDEAARIPVDVVQLDGHPQD
jgi:nucleotide-binding universal stress UspA family protein